MTAEGWIPKAIEKERKARSAEASEEASGSSREDQPGKGSDEAQSPPKPLTAEEEIKEEKIGNLADGLVAEAHRRLAKYPGGDVIEQDQTQAEKPGGGLLSPRRAKDMAASRRDLKQRTSRDRKTGSEPDVLFNTRDDTVSAVSKSAPQVKVAKGTTLRQPPGAPPSDPVTSLPPSGTDSEQGSRNSGESYVPTPQNSGSNPDTPAYREYQEEDSLIGRRVDRSLGS